MAAASAVAPSSVLSMVLLVVILSPPDPPASCGLGFCSGRWCSAAARGARRGLFTRTLGARSHGEVAPPQDVEADGEHHDHAYRDLLPVRVDANDDEAGLHDLEHQDAHHTARDSAGPTEQAHATDDDTCNHDQFPAGADGGRSALQVGHHEHA